MRIPGLFTLNKYLSIRYIPFLLLAATINILVFFFIQLMVTGEYNRVSVTTLPAMDSFIRVRRVEAPPQANEETRQVEQPVIQDDLPPPSMPMPQIAPPAPASPSSTPVAGLDVKVGTSAIPTLRRILSVSRPKPAAPKIATNLVPTLRIPPIYPQQALNDGIEGIVTVEFTIGTDGSVKDPQIVKARPEKVFDDAVLQAIRKWKYPPEIVNGQAVEVRARIDIPFVLQD